MNRIGRLRLRRMSLSAKGQKFDPGEDHALRGYIEHRE
jgi:hypothetical protein